MATSLSHLALIAIALVGTLTEAVRSENGNRQGKKQSRFAPLAFCKKTGIKRNIQKIFGKQDAEFGYRRCNACKYVVSRFFSNSDSGRSNADYCGMQAPVYGYMNTFNEEAALNGLTAPPDLVKQQYCMEFYNEFVDFAQFQKGEDLSKERVDWKKRYKPVWARVSGGYGTWHSADFFQSPWTYCQMAASWNEDLHMKTMEQVNVSLGRYLQGVGLSAPEVFPGCQYVPTVGGIETPQRRAEAYSEYVEGGHYDPDLASWQKAAAEGHPCIDLGCCGAGVV